ncbi:MAG: YidC/Oxa1 family insertase periplasmic-domain containing protein [Leptospirales bacterium]
MKSYLRKLLVLAAVISFNFTATVNVYAQAGSDSAGSNSKEASIIPKESLVISNFTKESSNHTPSEKVIETTYFNITINSKGGMLTSFRHKDPENQLKNNVEIVDVENPFRFDFYLYNRAGKFDTREFMQALQYNLDVRESGDFITVRAQVSIDAVHTDVQKNKDTIIPLLLEKVYRFHKTLHYWDFQWNVTNKSSHMVSLSELRFLPINKIGPVPETNSSMEMRNFNAFYYLDEDFETKSSVDSGEGMMGFGGSDEIWEKDEKAGTLGFFGMASRFMIIAMQPLTKTDGVVVENDYEKEMVMLHAMPEQLTIKRGQTMSHSYIVYTGPKVNHYMEIDQAKLQKNPELKHMHPKIYKAFDFGVTAPIRDAIVSILKFFYKFIPNYGIGIILFALFFKLIFFPLNQAQAKSMKKMQVLQPQIKEINEKYKNNPQLKQQKTLALYKKNKANPLGGCLPMVIQIPIFIALYSAFSNAYELWGSPFIPGWIDDLSKPDTLFLFPEGIPFIGGGAMNLLPLLMVASQFLQTKLTTVSGDKNQKMMMFALPFMMLFFFYTMPSGVVLYWIVFNVFSIVQQVLTKSGVAAAVAPK